LLRNPSGRRSAPIHSPTVKLLFCGLDGGVIFIKITRGDDTPRWKTIHREKDHIVHTWIKALAKEIHTDLVACDFFFPLVLPNPQEPWVWFRPARTRTSIPLLDGLRYEDVETALANLMMELMQSVISPGLWRDSSHEIAQINPYKDENFMQLAVAKEQTMARTVLGGDNSRSGFYRHGKDLFKEVEKKQMALLTNLACEKFCVRLARFRGPYIECVRQLWRAGPPDPLVSIPIKYAVCSIHPDSFYRV
jgi:hypothetical protein